MPSPAQWRNRGAAGLRQTPDAAQFFMENPLDPGKPRPYVPPVMLVNTRQVVLAVVVVTDDAVGACRG